MRGFPLQTAQFRARTALPHWQLVRKRRIEGMTPLLAPTRTEGRSTAGLLPISRHVPRDPPLAPRRARNVQLAERDPWKTGNAKRTPPNLPKDHSQKSSNFISLPLNPLPIRASSPHPTPMLKLRRAENYFPQSPRR